jgi:serine/threonine protein kinase/Tfp pilus assembly protein PilF
MIGSTISHYKILEKLGEGGMGVVYRAQDTSLNRLVALKFLPEHVSASADDTARFVQEAQAAAALNHPNICTIYGIEQSEGKSFIVMEFVDGQTLQEKKSSLSLKQALEVGIQIAEGLAAAHEKGIVHRDIKPENIMFRKDGRVQIMDFGLAKLRGASRLTKEGSTVGTAGYMSPEQVRGEDVDKRSDLFSLGVVIYEMLAGKLPFRGEHQAALMYSLVNEDPQPLSRFDEHVSPDIERIIVKALAKDADERYQSADDMLADFRRERKNLEYAHASQATMRSMPAMPAAQRSRNKNRMYVFASSIVAAALILVYFFFFGQGGGISSIAVLPFSITSSDSSAEILSDGVTEGIINNLSTIPSLTVMSWTSVSHYNGEHADIRDIGRKLNVAAVLVGRIIQRGDTYDISVELVDAGNERHLWGAQFNKQATALYSLQGELSKAISKQLQIELTGEEEQRLAKNNTENSEAFSLYLNGLYYLNKRTRDGIMKGIDYFNRSVEKDPNYTHAYVGLSFGYELMVDNYYMSAGEGFPKAKEAAQYALKLDDNLAEAHTSLADILNSYDWDWPGAQREYRKAIELNPNFAEAHHWYALALACRGLFDEAIGEIKRAQQLDPLSMRINQNIGYIYYQSRQYDKAIDQLQNTMEIDSTFPYGNAELGDCYFMKKQYDIAYTAYQAEIRNTGDSTNIFLLACLDAAMGKKEEAMELREKLKILSTRTFVVTSYFAFIEIYLGNNDQAFSLLQKAVVEKDPYAIYLKTEPKFDPIRSDPRFAQLLKEVHLTP